MLKHLGIPNEVFFICPIGNENRMHKLLEGVRLYIYKEYTTMEKTTKQGEEVEKAK